MTCLRSMRCALLFLLFACSPSKAPEKSPEKAPPQPVAAERARPRPALPSAAFTWAVAEASHTAAAWTAVADASAAELARCTKDCRELAYQVVLARKNAVTAANLPKPEGEEWTPVPVPAEVQATVDALDAYVAMLDATDDEVAPMKFLAASSLWRYRQPGALPRLEALLREYRDDATAEYAANQLLDALMRAGNLAELRAWAAELAADETFLANKPELRATLERITTLLAQQE